MPDEEESKHEHVPQKDKEKILKQKAYADWARIWPSLEGEAAEFRDLLGELLESNERDTKKH